MFRIILHCAGRKGKLFAKLDCKDAFFQTLMKGEDTHMLMYLAYFICMAEKALKK